MNHSNVYNENGNKKRKKASAWKYRSLLQP